MLLSKMVARVEMRISKLISWAGVCPAPGDYAMLEYSLMEMNNFAIGQEWL